jgi:large subunit ribosomal protein L4
MRTGGVAMGPRNTNNYKKAMPRKQRRLALFSALSAKFKDGKILALDTYDETEIKTKKIMALIQKLPVEKDVLIVIPEKNPTIEKSSNNIPFAKSILVNYLNIADIQNYDHLLFLEESIRKMKEIFLPKVQ